MRLSLCSDIGINVLLPLFLGAASYVFPVPLPGILRSHGADGLWAYAFMSMLLIVWERKLPRSWIPAPFLVATAYEAGQWGGFLPGTGDVWDLFVYGVGFSFSLLLNHFYLIKPTTN
jgi:hypothetical protein